MYLVHICEEIMGKVLKRIRQLDVDGNVDKLHKRKLTIKYTDADLISPGGGSGLASAIKSHVPDGMDRYVERKKEALKTLGFEDGVGEWHVTFGEESPIESLLDLALGLTDSIDVEKFSMTEKRFGIRSKLELPNFTDSGGSLSMPGIQGTDATIGLKEHKFAPAIEFPAKYYSSKLSHRLPKEYLKIRIATDFFEFTLKPYTGEGGFEFTLEGDQRASLHEYAQLFRFIGLLNSRATEVILTISTDHPGDIEFQASNLKGFDFDYLDECQEASEAAKLICTNVGIDTSVITSTPNELLRMESSLGNMKRLLSAQAEEFTMTFSIDSVDKSVSLGKTACVMFVSTIVGRTVIGIFIAISGEAKSSEGNRYKLTPKTIVRGPVFHQEEDQAVSEQDITGMFEGFQELLEKDHEFIVRLFQFDQLNIIA